MSKKKTNPTKDEQINNLYSRALESLNAKDSLTSLDVSNIVFVMCDITLSCMDYVLNSETNREYEFVGGISDKTLHKVLVCNWTFRKNIDISMSRMFFEDPLKTSLIVKSFILRIDNALADSKWFESISKVEKLEQTKKDFFYALVYSICQLILELRIYAPETMSRQLENFKTVKTETGVFKDIPNPNDNRFKSLSLTKSITWFGFSLYFCFISFCCILFMAIKRFSDIGNGFSTGAFFLFGYLSK